MGGHEWEIGDVMTLCFPVLKCFIPILPTVLTKKSLANYDHWSYLASLVFGENYRKISVNTLGPEIIKWWHHQCVSHKVMTSTMSVQSESSICWGAFPTSWIFIENSLVTSSLFGFQMKYFHSPRLVHTALQIQRLAKYDQCHAWNKTGGSKIPYPMDLNLFCQHFRGTHDCTWRAFEFERAVWTSQGEWKHFIWKPNNDDVTRGFFNKYCFLIGQTLVMSSLYETPIGDVMTLWFLVLKCLHQFSCSSYQKQGSPSTIHEIEKIWTVLLRSGRGTPPDQATQRILWFRTVSWTWHQLMCSLTIPTPSCKKKKQENMAVKGRLLDFYRLQQSWGKVMFLQASLILLTGGYLTPPEQTPPEQTPPWSTHPLEQRPPRADTPTPQSRHPLEHTPPRADRPPQSRHTPPVQTPPRADTPLEQNPPRAETPTPKQRLPPLSMLLDTVNAWVVRILLECNLVFVGGHPPNSGSATGPPRPQGPWPTWPFISVNNLDLDLESKSSSRKLPYRSRSRPSPTVKQRQTKDTLP